MSIFTLICIVDVGTFVLLVAFSVKFLLSILGQWVQTLATTNNELPINTNHNEGPKFPRLVGKAFDIEVFTIIDSKQELLTKEITFEGILPRPFSKLIVLEFPLFLPETHPAYDYNTRLLISDITEVSMDHNAIYLDISFQQYILFLDVCFNFCDSLSVFDDENTRGNENGPKWDEKSEDENRQYGSPQYCAYMVNQSTHFEVVMGVHEVFFNMSVEAEHAASFTSLNHMKDCPGAYLLSQQKSIPVAFMRALNMVAHFKVGGDVVRMATGLGGFDLTDTRIPEQSIPELRKLLALQV